MKEHLTPQEAALYLGQEILVSDRYDKDLRGKLVSISYGTLDIAEDTYGLSEWKFRTCNPKLLLRPLSDITEEEFDHLKSVIGGYSKREKLEQVYGTSIIQYINEGSGIGGVLDVRKINAESFAYLLSKGFDLFNWIEQGKALDKTAHQIPTPKSEN